MPSAIDATVGGANSNSYITLAEADTYHDDRLHNAEWAAASNDDKTRAILMARRVLDELKYEGYPATSAQALRFPRSWIYDADGTLYATDIIPQIVKDAQAEYCLYLIRSDVTLDDSDDLDSVKVGSIAIDFNVARAAKAMPDAVRAILRPLLGPYGALNVVRA